MMMDKRLIGTVRESKKYIAGNVALQWCSLAANIAMMTAVTDLLASLFTKRVEKADMIIMVFVAVLAVAIRFICTVFSSYMGYLSSKAVKKILREKIYKKLLQLGSSYQEQVKTSEVVQVSVEGVEQLETYLCYAGASYAVCVSVLCKRSFCYCPVGLCSLDSYCHSGGTDLGEKTAVKLLGAVYGFGQYLFRKSARIDYAKNLSDRWV